MTKLHVIVASHNRARTTESALRSLHEAISEAGVEYDVTLFDDGSSDDTIARAAAVVDELTVLRGDGSAFWARSMATAEAAVLARDEVRDDDWLLWFNDDVLLERSGLRSLIEAARQRQAGILVGSTVDPASGALTYGGLRREGPHPLAFALVQPPNGATEAERADAFNGNIVLMPVHIARTVGPIDGGFSHAYADVDYGMRATSKGVPIWVLGGTAGYCSRNPAVSHHSLVAAWRSYTGQKGAGNPRSLRRYLHRHNARSWWFFYLASYALWWGRTLRRAARRGGVRR
jgi:GT2 family glycosyltransferase